MWALIHLFPVQEWQRCWIFSQLPTGFDRHCQWCQIWLQWTFGTACVCVSSTLPYWNSCVSTTWDERDHSTTSFTGRGKIQSLRYISHLVLWKYILTAFRLCNYISVFDVVPLISLIVPLKTETDRIISA